MLVPRAHKHMEDAPQTATCPFGCWLQTQNLPARFALAPAQALPVVARIRRVFQLEHAIGHQRHAEARGACGVDRVVHVGAQGWGRGRG